MQLIKAKPIKPAASLSNGKKTPFTSQARIESRPALGISASSISSMFWAIVVPICRRSFFLASDANNGNDVSEIAIVKEITTVVILFGLAEK